MSSCDHQSREGGLVGDDWSTQAAARSRAEETAIADLRQGDYVYPSNGRHGVVSGFIDAGGGWQPGGATVAVFLEDGRTLTFRPGQTVKTARP